MHWLKNYPDQNFGLQYSFFLTDHKCIKNMHVISYQVKVNYMKTVIKGNEAYIELA